VVAGQGMAATVVQVAPEKKAEPIMGRLVESRQGAGLSWESALSSHPERLVMRRTMRSVSSVAAFFQLGGAGRAPQCSRCGSSFVQFLRPPGNENWIRADSQTGLAYSFDDQLENSITASLDETPCQRRPTQGAFLRTLPTFLLSEEEVQARRKLDCKDPKCGCAICREGFCIGDCVKRLPCNHEFHDMCIVPWLKDRSTCPICRCKFPEAAEGEEDEEGDVVRLKCGSAPATTEAARVSAERSATATPERSPAAEHGPESDDGVPTERTGNSSTLPGADPQPSGASLDTGGGSTSVVRYPVAPVDTSGSSG